MPKKSLRGSLGNKNQKNKNKMYYLAIIVFIVSLIIFILVILLVKNSVIEKRIIKTAVEVKEKNRIGIGFFGNSSFLDFGIVSEGSGTSKNMIIKNEYDTNIIIKVKIIGEIRKFVSYKSNLRIEKNKTGNLGFAVYIPPNTEMGKYDGEIELIFKKII